MITVSKKCRPECGRNLKLGMTGSRRNPLGALWVTLVETYSERRFEDGWVMELFFPTSLSKTKVDEVSQVQAPDEPWTPHFLPHKTVSIQFDLKGTPQSYLVIMKRFSELLTHSYVFPVLTKVGFHCFQQVVVFSYAGKCLFVVGQFHHFNRDIHHSYSSSTQTAKI